MTLTELAPRAGPPAPLVASVSRDATATIVTLCGEADVFTLPVVVDALARVISDSEGPVIVDLAETDFIDAATVRALSTASQLLNGRGRMLALRSPRGVAARILHLFDLSHLIEPDRASAN